MDVPSRVAALETRLDSVLPTLATKSDVAELRTKMVTMEARLVKWTVGVGVASLTVLISAVWPMFMFIASKLDEKPSAAAPVIINVPAVAPAAPAVPGR